MATSSTCFVIGAQPVGETGSRARRAGRSQRGHGGATLGRRRMQLLRLHPKQRCCGRWSSLLWWEGCRASSSTARSTRQRS